MSNFYDLFLDTQRALTPDVRLAQEDFEWAIFLATNIAVLMNVPLDEVIENVKGYYEVSLDAAGRQHDCRVAVPRCRM
jgi:hypothetical protein